MSDVQVQVAPQTESPQTRAASILGALADAKVLQMNQAPPAETPPPAGTPPPAETPPAEAPKPVSALAAEIRADRERRARVQTQEREEASAKARVAELEAKLAAHETGQGPRFEDDPVGVARARKWTREQQLMYAQALLYDLAPQEAPADFRTKLFEARYEREKAEQARAQAEAAQRAEVQDKWATMEAYQRELDDAAQNFAPGTYPESEVYFRDRSAYVGAMIAAANDLAEVAASKNEMADLSPAAIAREVEAEVARLMAARDQRKQKSAPAPQGQPPRAPQPSPGPQYPDTLSSRQINGGGMPQVPALTEHERLARAAEALFSPRHMAPR